MPDFKNLSVTVMILTLSVSIFSACSTGNQVLKYENKVNRNDNIVPGIEAPESDEKMMVAATGKGLEPENGSPAQKRFMAERAATIDGYRKLAERLGGIILHSSTKAGMSEVTSDVISTEVNTYMRGARVHTVDFKDGYAIVEVRVYIAPRDSRFYN